MMIVMKGWMVMPKGIYERKSDPVILLPSSADCVMAIINYVSYVNNGGLVDKTDKYDVQLMIDVVYVISKLCGEEIKVNNTYKLKVYYEKAIRRYMEKRSYTCSLKRFNSIVRLVMKKHHSEGETISGAMNRLFPEGVE